MEFQGFSLLPWHLLYFPEATVNDHKTTHNFWTFWTASTCTRMKSTNICIWIPQIYLLPPILLLGHWAPLWQIVPASLTWKNRLLYAIELAQSRWWGWMPASSTRNSMPGSIPLPTQGRLKFSNPPIACPVNSLFPHEDFISVMY